MAVAIRILPSEGQLPPAISGAAPGVKTTLLQHIPPNSFEFWHPNVVPAYEQANNTIAHADRYQNGSVFVIDGGYNGPSSTTSADRDTTGGSASSLKFSPSTFGPSASSTFGGGRESSSPIGAGSTAAARASSFEWFMGQKADLMSNDNRIGLIPALIQSITKGQDCALVSFFAVNSYRKRVTDLLEPFLSSPSSSSALSRSDPRLTPRLGAVSSSGSEASSGFGAISSEDQRIIPDVRAFRCNSLADFWTLYSKVWNTPSLQSVKGQLSFVILVQSALRQRTGPCHCVVYANERHHETLVEAFSAEPKLAGNFVGSAHEEAPTFSAQYTIRAVKELMRRKTQTKLPLLLLRVPQDLPKTEDKLHLLTLIAEYDVGHTHGSAATPGPAAQQPPPATAAPVLASAAPPLAAPLAAPLAPAAPPLAATTATAMTSTTESQTQEPLAEANKVVEKRDEGLQANLMPKKDVDMVSVTTATTTTAVSSPPVVAPSSTSSARGAPQAEVPEDTEAYEFFSYPHPTPSTTGARRRVGVAADEDPSSPTVSLQAKVEAARQELQELENRRQQLQHQLGYYTPRGPLSAHYKSIVAERRGEKPTGARQPVDIRRAEQEEAEDREMLKAMEDERAQYLAVHEELKRDFETLLSKLDQALALHEQRAKMLHSQRQDLAIVQEENTINRERNAQVTALVRSLNGEIDEARHRLDQLAARQEQVAAATPSPGATSGSSASRQSSLADGSHHSSGVDSLAALRDAHIAKIESIHGEANRILERMEHQRLAEEDEARREFATKETELKKYIDSSETHLEILKQEFTQVSQESTQHQEQLAMNEQKLVRLKQEARDAQSSYEQLRERQESAEVCNVRIEDLESRKKIEQKSVDQLLNEQQALKEKLLRMQHQAGDHRKRKMALVTNMSRNEDNCMAFERHIVEVQEAGDRKLVEREWIEGLVDFSKSATRSWQSAQARKDPTPCHGCSKLTQQLQKAEEDLRTAFEKEEEQKKIFGLLDSEMEFKIESQDAELGNLREQIQFTVNGIQRLKEEREKKINEAEHVLLTERETRAGLFAELRTQIHQETYLAISKLKALENNPDLNLDEDAPPSIAAAARRYRERLAEAAGSPIVADEEAEVHSQFSGISARSAGRSTPGAGGADEGPDPRGDPDPRASPAPQPLSTTPRPTTSPPSSRSGTPTSRRPTAGKTHRVGAVPSNSRSASGASAGGGVGPRKPASGRNTPQRGAGSARTPTATAPAAATTTTRAGRVLTLEEQEQFEDNVSTLYLKWLEATHNARLCEADVSKQRNVALQLEDSMEKAAQQLLNDRALLGSLEDERHRLQKEISEFDSQLESQSLEQMGHREEMERTIETKLSEGQLTYRQAVSQTSGVVAKIQAVERELESLRKEANSIGAELEAYDSADNPINSLEAQLTAAREETAVLAARKNDLQYQVDDRNYTPSFYEQLQTTATATATTGLVSGGRYPQPSAAGDTRHQSAAMHHQQSGVESSPGRNYSPHRNLFNSSAGNNTTPGGVGGLPKRSVFRGLLTSPTPDFLQQQPPPQGYAAGVPSSGAAAHTSPSASRSSAAVPPYAAAAAAVAVAVVSPPREDFGSTVASARPPVTSAGLSRGAPVAPSLEEWSP